jgi:hypothetical protein
MIKCAEARALVRRMTRLLAGDRPPVVDSSTTAQFARVARQLSVQGKEISQTGRDGQRAEAARRNAATGRRRSAGFNAAGGPQAIKR